MGRFRRGGTGLGGVRGVVLADAEHSHRAGDRGPDPGIPQLNLGKLTNCQGGAHPRYPVGTQEGAVDI